MSRPRILSVGQCGYDHTQISRHLAQTLGAEVQAGRTADEALAALRRTPFDLVLVNRVGDADGAPGVDLIRALKGDPDLAAVPVMLVSNYPDAQADAVALGALPGFGKADLARPETTEKLRGALAGTAAQS
jgi:response regulator RpfG family c-di-GMP phosphodiesterase